jgi:hypothetical protein
VHSSVQQDHEFSYLPISFVSVRAAYFVFARKSHMWKTSKIFAVPGHEAAGQSLWVHLDLLDKRGTCILGLASFQRPYGFDGDRE